MSINRWMDKDVVHIYNAILLSHKKNEIVPLAETWMDLEAVTQSESEREKQILHNITYMWDQEKWYRWTYLQSRNRDNRWRDQTYGHQGGRGKWDELGDGDWHIHTTMYKIDN